MLKQPDKPNLLIFNPDEMRSDSLHHLGHEAACTPNLDAMLEDSVSFENAFCQNPVCTPSRCSFLSGWYPHVHGHRTMSYMMHRDEPVLLAELKRTGYHVWVSPRGDFVPADLRKPYAEYADTVAKVKGRLEHAASSVKGYVPRGEAAGDNYYSFYRGIIKSNNDDVYDMDAAWVDSAIHFIHSRPKNKPFCIFLPINYPHPPYQVAQKYYDMIDPHSLPKRIPTPDWDASGKASILKGIYQGQHLQGWSEERWNELRHVYLGMCARVDTLFGRVISALKETESYDDTGIFFFSDHGDYTGDYGLVEKNQNTFEDCLTKVPLIVKPPRNIPVKPGISKALVELIDFYATAIDFAGIKSDHTHFGKSLVPVLTGEKQDNRNFVFCEGGRLKSEEHCNETFYQKSGLNPSNEYYPRMCMQASQGPEHGKAVMIRNARYKFIKRLYEKDEFYDLERDADELYNAIDDIHYASIISEMKEALLSWYQETADTVPFKEDQRISREYILQNAKPHISLWQYIALKFALNRGFLSVFDLMQMAEKTKKQF
jgi:arylsulfatase A-like enzyme